MANDLTRRECDALGYLARAGSFSFHELPISYVRGGHALVRRGLVERRENALHKKVPDIFSKWEFRATDQGAHIGFHVE